MMNVIITDLGEMLASLNKTIEVPCYAHVFVVKLCHTLNHTPIPEHILTLVEI